MLSFYSEIKSTSRLRSNAELYPTSRRLTSNFAANNNAHGNSAAETQNIEILNLIQALIILKSKDYPFRAQPLRYVL
jgi:hypothetical protein